MQFEQVYPFVIDQLEKGLPREIVYHTADHTREVLAAAEKLGLAEGIGGYELVLLKTAALLHDTGFLTGATNHEEHSCTFAREHLPRFGYTDSQIDTICRTIMATKLPQRPTDRLGELLCDADLHYLGTDQYATKASRLHAELIRTGLDCTDNEWLEKQIGFISTHHFFTNTARNEYETRKQQTLDQLQSRLQQSMAHSTPAWEWIQDSILTILGVVIAGVALKLFLVPNRFFDGGITGISLLVHELYEFNLGLVILVLNLPLIVAGYFSVGKRFAYRTLISVILLGVCLLVIPDYPVTADKLLISIFGGAFLGIGIGLIMRVGAALDGIEVLALYALKRTSFTITELILGINIIIFSIAAFQFGIETALYSILTYFTATRCIDYVVEGLQAYTGVTIVSSKSEIIKYQLVNKMGRGITVYKGERGFLPGKYDISDDCDIIFTVITRLELRKLKNLVYDIDPQAFVFANVIKEASGGIIKKRKH